MFVFNFYKSLTFLFFYIYFLCFERRDIKESKNIYLTSFLIEASYGILIELTLCG